MKPFMDDDFLLETETAKHLYHTYAKHMPIIDYHCHLEAKDIADNRSFSSIADVWLGGDHYKWRLMRANGIDEHYVTGDASDEEKFDAWAHTVPLLIGNPLYHWTHLELRKFFQIDDLLSPKTAKAIYQNVNGKLTNMKARTFVSMSHVETICTTNDPTDDLSHHERIQNDPSITFKVVPAFRPDKAIDIEKPWFHDWFKTLYSSSDKAILGIDDYLDVLEEKIDFFHAHGARLADHALDTIDYQACDLSSAADVFQKVLRHEPLSQSEIACFKTTMLERLATMYHARGWVQQYHIGALRNINSRAFHAYGPDKGFDAINDAGIAIPLSGLLNQIDQKGVLPKTILYTLNPADFEIAITIMQSFQDGKTAGKIQFGSGWWFLDTIDGMEKQIKALANNGLLARFVGMLTDSRSFLSYSRHDYFRRILCNVIGDEVERGRYPYDEETLAKIVEDISYGNAKRYFGF